MRCLSSCTALVALSLALLPAVAPAQSEHYTLDPSKGSEAEWDRQANPDPDAPSEIVESRKALAEDDPNKARRLLDKWLKDNEHSKSRYLPEGYLLRGDALLAAGLEYKSLFDYELVIRDYQQSEQFLVAVEREYDIATLYIGGLKKRFIGMRLASGEEIGVELLIRVQERVPGSELAERASIDLGDYYYLKREMRLARDAYGLYLLNHPTGPNRMHAEKRLIYADIARFKGPRYDGSGLIDARVRIRDFRRRYPLEAERTGINEGLVARIDESMAARLLDSADWYTSQGDHASVRYTLRRLVAKYPRSLSAARALETLEARGWLDELETPTAPEEDRILIEGPGAGQVQPLDQDVRRDQPEPE